MIVSNIVCMLIHIICVYGCACVRVCVRVCVYVCVCGCVFAYACLCGYNYVCMHIGSGKGWAMGLQPHLIIGVLYRVFIFSHRIFLFSKLILPDLAIFHHHCACVHVGVPQQKDN